MALQSLLGVELPIIQAPMAGVQGSALAVAVSNAGGLGSLPGALLGPDALRQELGSEEAILGTRDLRINPELVEVDLRAFETARASGAFEEAARLYAGPFLGELFQPKLRPDEAGRPSLTARSAGRT